MKPSTHPIRFHQVTNTAWDNIASEVIVEAPVSLTVNGEIWLTFMCTPVDLEAMSIGFLYNEGVITGMDAVADVRLCPTGDNVDVWLNHSVQKPVNWRRTSGCTGGITSVENNYEFPAMLNGGVLTVDMVGRLINLLFESQDLYRTTGGVHTSALSDGERVLLVAEDIGRHNTLDKIAGLTLMKGITTTRRILLTTGRISSEMLQKARRMSASILISRTSPSSLSIELAERYGITLIGYARRNRFNIYTHPMRILIGESDIQNNVVESIF